MDATHAEPGHQPVLLEEAVMALRIRADGKPFDAALWLDRVFDPGHPLADEAGFYDGSNVDLITEIADAREAQRSYEANLRMFDQARQMTSDLLALLRR